MEFSKTCGIIYFEGMYKEFKMRKSVVLIIGMLFSVLLIAAFVSCGGNLFDLPSEIAGGGAKPEANPPDVLSNNGTLTARLFIPDYKKLSQMSQSGRAIAPQTTRVRLSIKGTGSTFTVFDTLTIDPGAIEPIESGPGDLPGGVWTGKFMSLKAGSYAAGNLKIELLDSADPDFVITSGLNDAAVTVSPEEAATAVFYTVPEVVAQSGTLADGEMKFCKIEKIDAESYDDVDSYVLTLTSSDPWPDIVLFNSDGTFYKYYQVSGTSDADIKIGLDEPFPFYVGIYADAGATSYSLEFKLVDKVGDLIVIIY